MKCLVCTKQVVDPYVNVRVKSDNSGVELTNVKMAMNPFDEIAIEAATQLKEANIVSEILAVSIGPASIQETLRQALARGADQALLIEATDTNHNSLTIAKIIQQVASEYQPQLILLGKQAIDDDCNQTGQMLAGLLGWAQATFASQITISDDQQQATITREIDGGLQTLSVKLPAVITTDLRLNEPRFISLPNVMQAKKKPLETKAITEFITPANTITTIKVEPPAARQAGIKVESVDELLQKLKEEARVL